MIYSKAATLEKIMELLALFDGDLIKAGLWFMAGLTVGYFVPAPTFIMDRFGPKN